MNMFSLEQGIISPRDGSINWLAFENYKTFAEAKKEARRSRGLWRIVEAKVIWHSEIDGRRKAAMKEHTL